MSKLWASGVAVALCLILPFCAGHEQRLLIDPSVLTFPFVEAGRVDIEGTVVGQPRARDGIVYLATREGFLTAVVAPSQAILWRFKADDPFSGGPELGEGHVIVHDRGNTLYVLDSRGGLVLEKQLEEPAATPVRERSGRLFYGTAAGKIMAIELLAGGALLWEYDASSPIVSGPVFSGESMVFGTAAGGVLALDRAGKLVWEFTASGKVAADPAEAGGRLYFGTEDRFFYSLSAATGKKAWSRRLQGAPLHPAVVQGGRLAVPASNSVVYFLSGRGGSILSWETVPSRIVHELSVSGDRILVSGGSQTITALDFKSGKRLGEHIASGPQASGALWVPPFAVVFESDPETGRQRLVILKPQEAAATATSSTSPRK